MLKALLAHQLARAEAGASFSAIADCHCKGVDSIMFYDLDGNKMRMFFARKEHELYRNRYPLSLDMSVAVHAHQSDLTLVGVLGRVTSTHFIKAKGSEFYECEYRSPLCGGLGEVVPTGNKVGLICEAVYDLENSLFLDAKTLHTVHVPMNEEAAWVVLEGCKDPSYKPVMYTKNIHFSAGLMYRPMSSAEVISCLEKTLDLLQ